MTSGKAWAANNLFQKEEAPVKDRHEDEAMRANATDGWLGRLRLGESRREGDLEVVALLRDGNGSPPGVLLTRQAVEAGLLEILERGDGVVQELLARNKGERPVAVLEGDTLVGCKQNRVVAHSVIVGPGTSLGIPVGCMEHGRWQHESARFAVGDTKIAPELRSRTQRDVKASFETRGERRLDQQRLWKDVDDTLVACRTLSPTSDYYEIVKREGRDARERAVRLKPAPGQVGAIVLADGALVGLEATGHHALWSAMAEATLSSYFMGLRRGTSPRDAARASAGEWLARVQSARVRTAPGLGLGTDLDVEGPGFAGVGLALGAVSVHVAVFPS
jgi:ARG/rhodanese/phosphatase superfamily protein